MARPKRRTNPSTRSGRKASGKRLPRSSKSRRNSAGARSLSSEALAAFSMVASLILFTGFISYLVQNGAGAFQSISTTDAQSISGPLVHVAMTLLVGLLGWCSLVPILWLAWLGHFFWYRHEQQRDFEHHFLLRAVFGFGGILLFSCTALSVLFEREGGGMLGTLLAAPLRELLGVFGGFSVAISCLLLAVAIATEQSIGRVLFGTIQSIGNVLVFLLWRLPGALVGYLSAGLRSLQEILAVGLDRIYELQIGDRLVALGAFFSRPFVSAVGAADEDEEEETEQPEKRRKIRPRASKPKRKRVEKEYEVKVERHRAGARASRRDLQRVQKRIVESNRQIAEQLAYAAYKDYSPPSLSLLSPGSTEVNGEEDAVLKEKSAIIVSKLNDFGIQGRVTHVHPGPVITLFEFEPAPGVKVRRIENLADDLAMSLRAKTIRIIAPIPQRGTVGIEVPNSVRETVRLRDLLESEAFVEDDSLLTVPIGKDTYGNPTVADIAKMPHLLIAGATGTGKSVCVNCFLTSLLYRASPAELGLILIDPKILELSVYEGVPHLRVPVVTEKKRVKGVLFWAVNEMEKRYRLMQKLGTRSIDAYNQVVLGEASPEEAEAYDAENETENLSEDVDTENPVDQVLSSDSDTRAEEEQGSLFVEKLYPLPRIVIVIDELADLMMSTGKEIEDLITRLAQKARAAGIHLILATQRPSVNVITGLIKANVPARISFRVSSKQDSRVVLDKNGAQSLLGYGDMLFLKPGAMDLQRLHGAFVSDAEVKRVVDSLKKRWKPQYDQAIIEMCEKVEQEEASSEPGYSAESDEYDEFYDRAVQLVIDRGKASTSMIQRAFRIGYNRAARILDLMEKDGVVGPMDGAKPREILLQRGIDGE